MNTVARIAKNTICLAVGHLVTLALGLFFVAVLARTLGDAGFGKYSFAITFTSLLAIFADLGLCPLAIREVTRNRQLAGKYLYNAAIIKLILSIITFALIFLLINIMRYPTDTKLVVYLFGIYAILNSSSQLFRSIFKAFERMEYEALLDILRKVILTSLGLWVLFSGYGLVELAYISILVGIIDFLCSYLVTVKKFAKPKIEIDFHLWRYLILNALPFAMTAIVGTVYVRIDIVMLSMMKGDTAVGWYSAAYNLILALVFIPDVFSYSIFPVMSKFFVSAKDSLKTASEKSAQYLFMVGLPIAVGTIILSRRFIILLYGQEFVNSIIAFQILSLYLPLRFVNHATGYTLSSINKEPLRALSATVAAVFNVLLNLALIPVLSYIGASIATALTEIVLFSFYYYFVAKHFYRLALSKVFIKPVIACLLMPVLAFFLRESNLALLIPIFVIVYLGVLYLLKAFSTEDKKMFRGMIKSLLGQPA